MSPRSSRIVRVNEEPLTKPVEGRTRYRVNLVCGCYWWEDVSAGAAPVAGMTRTCFASHNKSGQHVNFGGRVSEAPPGASAGAAVELRVS